MNSQKFFQLATATYEGLVRTASSIQSLFLLAVRLYWGWQFAQTGWGKLHNIARVTDFFTSLGIPAPGLNAVAVSWMEFLGGIFLALGLGSRFFGLILGFDMLVAYLTAGRTALLSIFSDPGKFYSDDAYTFLFASILILIFGPGNFSLDALTQRRFQFRITSHAPTSVAVQHS
jgi:putative oxidoreductase